MRERLHFCPLLYGTARNVRDGSFMIQRVMRNYCKNEEQKPAMTHTQSFVGEGFVEKYSEW